jgi:DNA-binding LacI/PurR family transcriptional regulator
VSTLYDVAKLAGVSPKTVSRVFNESHLVTAETRLRVMEIVKELDYHPNAIAASLKRQHSNVIGFVVPYGSDFVFQDSNMMEQLRGAHDILTQEGYDVLVSAPILKKNALSEASRLVKHRNIDGVILYPSAGVAEIINEFTAKKFNYVTLGVCFKEQKTNFVDLDLIPSAYMATKHLISQGHRYIGLINKPTSFFMYNKDDLLAGYKIALEESAIDFLPDLVHEGDYTFEGGYNALKSIFNYEPNVRSIICASDPMAYGAIKAIDDLKLEVGRDIEIIAGDNLPLTQKLFPYLSTINNPSYEQGKQAAKMIMTVIKDGTEAEGIFLNADFILRSKPLELRNYSRR